MLFNVDQLKPANQIREIRVSLVEQVAASKILQSSGPDQIFEQQAISAVDNLPICIESFSQITIKWARMSADSGMCLYLL